ncbi:MAG: GNAT family N-acetyltransferase [Pseudomonadales bacterium]
MRIRVAKIDADFGQIRERLIELQDYERQIDARMPSGETIADSYFSEMLKNCKAHLGQILVAEVDDLIVGYVTVLAKTSSGEIDDGDIEYGLIYDLVVKDKWRGNALGRKLIEASETFAKTNGARWLRLSVLAQNRSARALYSSIGFSELYVDYEKDLREPKYAD